MGVRVGTGPAFLGDLGVVRGRAVAALAELPEHVGDRRTRTPVAAQERDQQVDHHAGDSDPTATEGHAASSTELAAAGPSRIPHTGRVESRGFVVSHAKYDRDMSHLAI
jgi:hypothetical protein